MLVAAAALGAAGPADAVPFARCARGSTFFCTRVDVPLDRAASEEIKEIDLLQEVLHDDLAEWVYERLRRRPMVLPVVVEV